MPEFYKVTVPTTYVVEASSPEEAKEALKFASNREVTYSVNMRDMDLDGAAYNPCDVWGYPVDA